MHESENSSTSVSRVPVSVSVRVRPLAGSEKEGAWRTEENRIVPTGGLGNDGAYHLDNVFDERWTTQQVGSSSISHAAVPFHCRSAQESTPESMPCPTSTSTLPLSLAGTTR
jgi:hypothetical protein